MEAATVACRGGMLAPPRRHCHCHGVGAVAAARRRRRLIAAPLGEPLISVRSLNAVAAVAQENVQVDEDVTSTETLPLPPLEVPGKQVSVKFVLQRRCAFGQRFLVTGDDPALGLWDPAEAAALDWSEDHVWTVKKDLPANKRIELKFLLQDPSGYVRWQPSPNLTLQVADTPNTLVVYEDWDRAKSQRVTEEVEPSNGAEGVVFSGSNGAKSQRVSEETEPSNEAEFAIFSGSNDALPADEHQPDEHIAYASLHRGKMGANEENEVDQPQLTLDKDGRIPEELDIKASMVLQNGNAAADCAGRDGGEDDAILRDEDAGMDNRSASIFENDMAWTRKALQQLLRTLGFQAGTTGT